MRTPPRIMPALVTPFDERGELDLAAHASNLRTLARSVHGFLVAGSTGEGPYLEPGERTTLLRIARAELGGGPFLLCGVSAESTRLALAQIDEAAAGGADAALVMTPTSLVRGRDDLVAGHFLDVADASPLPVLLYTVPPVTGYELPVSAVVELSGHPNIVGMKDSGGDPTRLPPLREAMDRGFLVFCGASRAVAESWSLGAHGAITASANYAAPLLERILVTGTGQEELTALVETVERHGLPGTKAAAAAAGLRPGSPRRPLRPVDAAVAATVEEAVRAAGLA